MVEAQVKPEDHPKPKTTPQGRSPTSPSPSLQQKPKSSPKTTPSPKPLPRAEVQQGPAQASVKPSPSRETTPSPKPLPRAEVPQAQPKVNRNKGEIGTVSIPAQVKNDPKNQEIPKQNKDKKNSEEPDQQW
ncbi:protein TonB-like [Homarus americanus]|uniref:protein TonB-like n=1 Tax=Homarus americanus TaxID=6706 RepID=UPI001C45A0E8|nr:protein TonB-like [Homarus americanus]